MSRKTTRGLPVLLAAMVLAVVALSACSSKVQNPSPMVGKHVQIKYGPFKIPDVNSTGGGILPLEKGMLWNLPVPAAEMPCDNCFITGMKAGMTYLDGANANIDTGVWMHHLVLLASGNGKQDATCPTFGLPQLLFGKPGAERFFASGNERTAITPSRLGSYGYKVNSGESWDLIVDLMNMNTTAKDVYVTIDYDFVPGNTPGMKPVRPVWMDIDQCGTSEKTPPSNTAPYSLDYQWTSTVAGQIVGAGGHIHDGGTNMLIKHNGNVFCDSVARYGETPEYVDPTDDGHEGHSHGGTHISSMSSCYHGESPLPVLKVGDQLRIESKYDPTIYPQMVHDGKLHAVMGISIVYVAQ